MQISVHTSLEGRLQEMSFVAPPGLPLPPPPPPPWSPFLRPPSVSELGIACRDLVHTFLEGRMTSATSSGLPLLGFPPSPPLPPPSPPSSSQLVHHESGDLALHKQLGNVKVARPPPRLPKELLQFLHIQGMGLTQDQVAADFKMNVSTLRYKCRKDDVPCCFKKKIDLEVHRTRLKQVQTGRDVLRAKIKRLQQELCGDQLYGRKGFNLILSK